MTATDEIRRLLDERGITERLEYSSSFGSETTAWDIDLSDPMHELEASFEEFDSGSTLLKFWNCTPEQAIAATLGPGTCTQEEHGWSTEGDHARVWLSCGHDCMVETVADLPNFCPVCGAKVVSE